MKLLGSALFEVSNCSSRAFMNTLDIIMLFDITTNISKDFDLNKHKTQTVREFSLFIKNNLIFSANFINIGDSSFLIA